VKCERCRTEKYCSKDCQKKHWKKHKKKCRKKKITLPDILSTKKHTFIKEIDINYSKELGKSFGYKSKSLKSLHITVYVYDNGLKYIRNSDLAKEFSDINNIMENNFYDLLPIHKKISKKSSKEIEIIDSKRIEVIKILISEYVITITTKDNKVKLEEGKKHSYLYLTTFRHYFVKIRVSFDVTNNKQKYLDSIDNFVEKLIKKIV